MPGSRPKKAANKKTTETDFAAVWCGRLGLPRKDWQAAARKKAAELPFSDAEEVVLLVDFLLGDLSQIVRRDPSPATLALADSYGWFCYAMWQCASAFPAFPENYAHYLKSALTSATAPPRAAQVLAELTGDAGPTDGRCGFNRLKLAHPEVVRQSESVVHEGSYEFYLRANERYDEYLFYLKESRDFEREWKSLKELMPLPFARKKVIHRSLMPERNWVRGEGARFNAKAASFRALFDFFCWKYYLWGMESDRPLLLKTSVVFTPYGTQLFIPGYLSLDPKRDLDFSKVMRLHRARGVARQGPGFSAGRQDFAQLRRRAILADRTAKTKRLKGDDRYRYICAELGLVDNGDFRRLRKLLQFSKK